MAPLISIHADAMVLEGVFAADGREAFRWYPGWRRPATRRIGGSRTPSGRALR